MSFFKDRSFEGDNQRLSARLKDLELQNNASNEAGTQL
jgi:hypothetical protein